MVKLHRNSKISVKNHWYCGKRTWWYKFWLKTYSSVFFHLHVVKSILVRCFVLVFHVIKTVMFKLWHDTFFTLFFVLVCWAAITNTISQVNPKLRYVSGLLKSTFGFINSTFFLCPYMVRWGNCLGPPFIRTVILFVRAEPSWRVLSP